MDRRTRQELIDRLNRDAREIARHFELQYKEITPERANVKRRYGVCYRDGSIRIRLNHARSGRALRYSSLVATLCHELSHLRHFNHGLRFRSFNRQVLEFARSQGIYRPREQAPVPAAIAPPPRISQRPGPLQLTLFA